MEQSDLIIAGTIYYETDIKKPLITKGRSIILPYRAITTIMPRENKTKTKPNGIYITNVQQRNYTQTREAKV